MQSQWEQGCGEGNRALVCRDGVRRAKAQVEQDLTRDVTGNKTGGFCKCRGEKERPRREQSPYHC